ncbi:MAG TPA: AAA family ATPase [Candidatus Limnocylindrales bacterium]|nr:AAA family ATPase [Candidatus Limnocylindrales bacterium]
MHINGPTGVGKSAIAEGLVEKRPLALCLDIDALRVRLGQWRELNDSKQIARNLGFALVQRHLEAGHDVVLPQLIVREDVVDDLEKLAIEAGASFVEVILRAEPRELAARVERSRAGQVGEHPRDQFTSAELAQQTEYALEVLAQMAARRMNVTVVDVSGMSLAQATAAVVAVLV